MIAAIVIGCGVLLLLLLLPIPRRRHTPRHKGLPCVVTEDWSGHHRYCHTHAVEFDGRTCPWTSAI